jgi:hypothetical protein
MFGKSSSEVLSRMCDRVLVVILCLSTPNIDDEFDFGAIVRINAAKLLGAYPLQFSHGEIDSEALRKAREPLFKEIVGAVITEDYAKKHLIMRAHFGPERPEQEEEFEQYPTRSPTSLARWAEYEHGVSDFSKRFDDASE